MQQGEVEDDEGPVHSTGESCDQEAQGGLMSRCQPIEVAGMARLITSYRGNAKARGVLWGLSFEEAKTIVTSDCFYCGRPPTSGFRRKSSGRQFLHHGIDRVDNNRGYSPDNVVPCCRDCNMAKGSRSQEDFLSHFAMVAARHPVDLN